MSFIIPGWNQYDKTGTQKTLEMSDKNDSSKWIAAGIPFVFVHQDNNYMMVGPTYYINVYYIWTLNRPVINSEKCFLNNNPGNNDDLGLWIGDSTHLIIYLGQMSRQILSGSDKNISNVSGSRSYQFIEFY